MKPIKLPGPLSRSPKQKRTPYTLPPNRLRSRLSPDELRLIYVEGGQSKQPTGASLGRRLNNLPRLTSSSESTTTSTRSAPRPEWGKNLQNTMPANKPRNKKSRHISGQGNIQITRMTGLDSSGRNELGMQAGAKAGMNQPVVHPLDGTCKGRNPAWLEVTLPPGPLVVQYSAVQV